MPPIEDAPLRTLANRMLADYDARNPGTVFSEGLRLDLDDAWRLQGAVARLREQRGETVVGYKIGCTSIGNQQANGLTHPVWGRLWSTEQHSDGVQLGKANFANIALEAEFAVTLKRPVEPDSASLQAIVDAVERIYPVIELHNLVMRGGAPRGHELISNNCIHAGVVRGAGVPPPDAALTTDLALVFDGEVVDSWPAIQWPDDIVSSVGWLAQRLAQSGLRLKPGDLILTGAFGPPIALADGTRVDVTSSAFGSAGATFS